MRYVDEFRNPETAHRLLTLIRQRSTRPIQLMEFCGSHTHAIARAGLRQLLPTTVRLSSGPGCPVCVTASRDLDVALAMSRQPEVIFTTFGDMLRIPSNEGSLQEAKAQGADIRIVYSVLDALHTAQINPNREVVFLGIGFETTAPTVATAILQAQAKGLANFSVLSLHKLTPPAIRAVLEAGEVRLDGVIGPGHVTTILGSTAWEFLPRDYGMACAIAGFEALDILAAIYQLVDMIERGAPAISNAYGRGVSAKGNPIAQDALRRVFAIGPADWRGLGRIPESGLYLRNEYAAFNAAARFPYEVHDSPEPRGCHCGEVIRGVLKPSECALFQTTCTPDHPVGPCMVSSEGTCAAYAQYAVEV